MIKAGEIYLTFPWFSVTRGCSECDQGTPHHTVVSLRCHAILFLPFSPIEVVHVFKCDECNAEARVGSNFPIKFALLMLGVSVLVALGVGVLYFWFKYGQLDTRMKIVLSACWGVVALAGTLLARHKARKDSQATLETRRGGQRSFLVDMQNSPLVVISFGLALSLGTAYGLVPLLWGGEIPAPLLGALFRTVFAAFLFVYCVRKRYILTVWRVFAVNFALGACLVDLAFVLTHSTRGVGQIVCTLIAGPLLFGIHYWRLRTAGRGHREAKRMVALASRLESGDFEIVLRAFETLSLLLDSPALEECLERIVQAARKGMEVDVRLRARFKFLTDFLEDLHATHMGTGKTKHILRQRANFTTQHLLMLHDECICLRREGFFGADTQFIGLGELAIEPGTGFCMEQRQIRSAALWFVFLGGALLVRGLGVAVPPVMWVFYGVPSGFALLQSLLTFGRAKKVMDRFRTRTMFAIYLGRPNRRTAAAFIDALSGRLEAMHEAASGGESDRSSVMTGQ